MRYFVLLFSSLYSNKTLNEAGKALKGLVYDDLSINVSFNLIELYYLELFVNGVYNLKSNNKNEDDSFLKKTDLYLGVNVNLFLFHSVGVFLLIYNADRKTFFNKENYFLRCQYQFLLGRVVFKLFTDFNISNKSFSWIDNYNNQKFIGFSLGYFVHDKISMSGSSRLHFKKVLKFLKFSKD